MTLTYVRDLNSVKVNQHRKHLDQTSFHSQVIGQTETHTGLVCKEIAPPQSLNDYRG